jgi:hypothetical protein
MKWIRDNTMTITNISIYLTAGIPYIRRNVAKFIEGIISVFMSTIFINIIVIDRT